MSAAPSIPPRRGRPFLPPSPAPRVPSRRRFSLCRTYRRAPPLLGPLPPADPGAGGTGQDTVPARRPATLTRGPTAAACSLRAVPSPPACGGIQPATTKPSRPPCFSPPPSCRHLRASSPLGACCLPPVPSLVVPTSHPSSSPPTPPQRPSSLPRVFSPQKCPTPAGSVRGGGGRWMPAESAWRGGGLRWGVGRRFEAGRQAGRGGGRRTWGSFS